MKPSIYKIDAPMQGALFIMPKPSSEWLRDDVKFYAETGIEHVVSLLESDENSDLGLSKEDVVCGEFGLNFTSFPMPDRGIPETGDFKTLVTELANQLKAGSSLAVHCRAGIGRSGLLACCILKAIGLEADEAIALVSDARRLNIPDTQIQIDFIQSYSGKLLDN